MAAPSSAPSPADPPYYILVAQSPAPANPTAPASSSLSHPVIEYHYADDSPAALLPQFTGQHVLVLDYDDPRAPTVRSFSHDLAVSALKVTDAPGAAAAGEPALRNTSMYVIETTIKPADYSPLPDDDEQHSVHAVLARFKQRNAVLRRILDYPNLTAPGLEPPTNATSPSSTTPQA